MDTHTLPKNEVTNFRRNQNTNPKTTRQQHKQYPRRRRYPRVRDELDKREHTGLSHAREGAEL